MRWFAFLFLGTAAVCAADRCSLPPEIAQERKNLDSSVYQRRPVRERYQRLWESHPDSLDYQYLRARSLVGSNTPEALRLYGEILEKDPDYPWVHLSQLLIFRSVNVFRNRDQLAQSFDVITRVCPALFEPYSYLNEIADYETAARGAVRLRAMLQDAKSPRELRLFSTLWAVEFRVRPAADQDEERRQVGEDLKRLMPLDEDPAIRPVIETGAKLIHDDALAQRMAPKRDPNRLVMDASNEWLRKHPDPKDDDAPTVRAAYGEELLAKSEEWHKMAPGDFVVGYYRIRAMTFLNSPASEIERAGDEFLEVIRRQDPAAASWVVSLAAVYMHAGVLLDRVPALIAEAIERLDDPEAVIEIDLAPNHQRTLADRQKLVSDHVDAVVVLAQTYEKKGDRNKAHATLWQASDYLASKAPSHEATDKQVLNWYTISRHYILRVSAEMAEREGRKLDALNGYREALAARPMNREALLARERKLWTELGGTDEGWQQWITPIEVVAASVPEHPEGSIANRSMPPLSAKDLQGNQWTLDRLAGKTTVAVVWATWCIPCRAELPYFAKLADQLKGRSDVLAISLNIDDNIALAESFVKSNGYTFPVLAARQYAEDLMSVFSVPRTWIIRNGIITREFWGFRQDEDKWVEEMLAELK